MYGTSPQGSAYPPVTLVPDNFASNDLPWPARASSGGVINIYFHTPFSIACLFCIRGQTPPFFFVAKDFSFLPTPRGSMGFKLGASRVLMLSAPPKVRLGGLWGI